MSQECVNLYERSGQISFMFPISEIQKGNQDGKGSQEVVWDGIWHCGISIQEQKQEQQQQQDEEGIELSAVDLTLMNFQSLENPLDPSLKTYTNVMGRKQSTTCCLKAYRNLNSRFLLFKPSYLHIPTQVYTHTLPQPTSDSTIPLIIKRGNK